VVVSRLARLASVGMGAGMIVAARAAVAARRSSRTRAAGSVIVVCGGCELELEGRLMHDSKTAPGAMWDTDGTARATVPNAWALPAGPLEIGGSCPGATAACSGCYAAVLEAAYSSLRGMLEGNLASIEHALDCGGIGTAAALLQMVVERSADLQRADGVERPSFRWHADGDIFSERYARAMRRAILATGDVDHWCYTRTLGAVRILAGTRGLRLFVSADCDNVERAARVAVRHRVPLAYLADDYAARRQLLERARAATRGAVLEAVNCPATDRWQRDGHGPAHIVGPDRRRSSLERGGPAIGACIACGLCLPGGLERSVVFMRHGRARDALGSVQRVRIGARS